MASQISRVFVWILLALVLVGMIGFGSFNFGGTANSIGKVGDTDISADTYYAELNSELRAFENVTGARATIAMAQQLGLTDNVLDKVIAATAYKNETANLGISVGDDQLSKRIREIPAFSNAAGVFERETYDFVLEQSGLTASAFEEGLRDDVASTILQAAVGGGAAVQPIYTNTLYSWARELRSFTWAKMGETDLNTPLPAPSEDDLTAFYEAHPGDFTAPEAKDITYVWMTPEALVTDITLDDETVRAAYDSRLSEYQTPELRMGERLVFGSVEDAQEAADRLASGALDFEALVTERGLSLEDVDMGDPVAEADVSGPVGALMFGAEVGQTVGPVETSLGPALIRVNAVIDAAKTTFDEAKAELSAELAADTARRRVADLAIELDEMLAGGATLEELADTFPALELGQINWSGDMSDGIAAYEEFRSRAAQVTDEDYPEIEVLEDDSLLALRVNGTIAAHLQPLDEVRDAAIAGWSAQKLTEVLRAQADEMIEQFAAGESPSSLGLTEIVETGQPREAFIAGTPSDFVAQVFKLNADVWAVIEDADGVVLVRVDEIAPADPASEEALDIKAAFEARMSQAIGNDIQTAFSDALQEKAGLEINREMINAIHTNFP